MKQNKLVPDVVGDAMSGYVAVVYFSKDGETVAHAARFNVYESYREAERAAYAGVRLLREYEDWNDGIYN